MHQKTNFNLSWSNCFTGFTLLYYLFQIFVLFHSLRAFIYLSTVNYCSLLIICLFGDFVERRFWSKILCHCSLELLPLTYNNFILFESCTKKSSNIFRQFLSRICLAMNRRRTIDGNLLLFNVHLDYSQPKHNNIE